MCCGVLDMLTASCLCNGVSIEVSGKLGPVVYCHCSRCQKASGTAFAANASVRRKYWTYRSGAELVREFESSEGVFRAFCSACGSPVYSRRNSEPETLRLRLGIVDGDPGRRSIAHFWVGSKAHWFEISDSLPQYEFGPAEHEAELSKNSRS